MQKNTFHLLKEKKNLTTQGLNVVNGLQEQMLDTEVMYYSLKVANQKLSLHRRNHDLVVGTPDLPYFDPPTMLVIDPMHNLFLGLAKHFTKKNFLK